MSGIHRRSVLMAGLGAGAAGLSGLRTTSARAAEFSYKLGVDWPTEHPSSLQAKATCDRIRELTNGRVDIQFFPNNMLGGDTDMLSQVRSGALELMLIPTGVFSTFLPVAAINNVGFAFNGYDQVWKAMDGDLGAHVRAQVTKAGLVVMDRIWDNGFRNLTTSNRPVNALSDVKGLKVRVPVSPIFTSMWSALGASPVSANVSELYSALQTKVFDGQENALPHLQFYKLFEVQKYCAMTSHMWEGFWLIGNRKAWGRLPADLQELVAKAFDEGAVKQRAILASFLGSLEGQLKSEGITFTTPDRAPFREILSKSGFYQQWRKQFGEEAWGRLEAVAGTLA
ncbi:TRAP transporter substrate-binding protein [Methylobacterium trifolii]|uniref:Sialic acid-binding periplasmic protein SiaP n=1 Tax=Methylobacterium trifolii TaxID=1003092 RepID=A0ABQ4U4P3_9HYPH|nr:TRAP transporter substrate-binding protein [Methylobacterium trifolii]GJE61357.1 Sialic acid-binding periplasmic protein SiaP [Methylobacterium trifolii]